MPTLPEPTPTATAAGQATNPLTDSVIAAAVDNAIEKAKRQGTSPKAVIGNTPPVEQPGRAAMSGKAVDDTVRIIAFGGTTFLTCGGVALVMVTSEVADPTAIGTFFGGLAVLALAVARLLHRAGQAAPTEIHQTYTGDIYQDQRNVQNKNIGAFVKNTNQQ
ncbi:hypothetical protein [Streptomyces swartbergensis]|uniref:Uncharacterized protein n=1 Tax=Streptomyces swartbergensis TaxID=487165 RepID=A0A243SAB9_9ACTN|nr:hypothetical protein [Streptomyces swartbergensis]OUD04665.1 hypothetical protein CA983_02600 [Streptomyces swartbergensis]